MAVNPRMNTTKNVSTLLTKKSQDLVSEQLRHDWSNSPMDILRTRFKLIDLSYFMENDEHMQQTGASRIITTLYKELELPVIQPNVDAAHAYLTGIFTSGYPMFGVVHTEEDPNAAEVADRTADAMEAIIAENSDSTGWKRNFNLWLKAALKYNLAAIEMDWKVQKSFNLSTDTNVSLTEGAVTDAYRAGNEAQHWDMYNTFFDTSCAPSQIHRVGDYAGTVELLTATKLHQLIENLRANSGTVMNINDKLWESSPAHNWYHEPHILTDNIVTSGMDWQVFFNTSSAPVNGKYHTSKFEKVTYFRRIIPASFGIGHVPSPNTMQIWKFIEVNGIIIYAERRTNAHNLLPVVFCQPYEDALGLQTKGLAQILTPFQKLSSTFYKARVASLARALSDRMLYDPTRVSEKHINSVIPSAKIPVRPAAYGKPLGEAVYHLPFDDRNGQMLHQDINFLENKASDAAHINKAQRGQFTKGNRTLGEYADIQDNADGTQLAMAQLIEDQAMVPIKMLIKTNILQYQTNTSLPIPNSTKVVDIDPVKLRTAVTNFKLADGLLNKDKLLGVQPTLEAFQIMSQDPQAKMEYDLTRMLVKSLEARGANITIYKRTEEQKAEIVQREQQARTPLPPPQEQQQ